MVLRENINALYENGKSKKLAVGVDNMWSNKEMQKTDNIGLKYEC